MTLGLGAAAALTGSLLAMLAPSVATWYGLPELGPIVDAGLPAARVVAAGAAALTVGGLLLAAVLAPGDPCGSVSPEGYSGLRTARAWSAVHALASAAVAVLLVAENTGLPPGQLIVRTDALLLGLGQIQQASGWLLSALVAASVTVLACWVLSWRSAVGLLGLALGGLLPVTLTAATNAERSHDIVADALTLHVLAAVVWLGSTAAVVTQLARRHSGSEVLRRHRAIAAWSLPVVGVSGVISAGYAVAPGDLLTTGYGWLVVLSALLLAALGVLHWRVGARAFRSEGSTSAGRRVALQVAAVELLLLGVAVSAGTGLNRVFPPADAGYVTSRLVYLIGYELPAQLTAGDLVLRWRFDLVFGTLAVLAALAYLRGVRRLRRSGVDWPVGRILAWLAGCATLLVATSSGLASYASAVFSVHMAQHMLLATVAPVLFVLGHGVTLALTVMPARPAQRLASLLDAPAVRLVRHPAVGWTAVAVTLWGLYPTGVFETVLQQHWAHLAMDAAFLATGLALFWAVLGYSLPGGGLPAIGRLVMVFAVMALHAGFAAWLLSQPIPVAGVFYSSLQLPYVPDLLADQRRGALLAWGFGELPVVLAVLALVTRWSHTDHSPPDPQVWTSPAPDAGKQVWSSAADW